MTVVTAIEFTKETFLARAICRYYYWQPINSMRNGRMLSRSFVVLVLIALQSPSDMAAQISAKSPSSPARDQPLNSTVPASPGPTAAMSLQTIAELRQIQRAALESNYAYRQVAHLSDNIGPRLSGS